LTDFFVTGYNGVGTGEFDVENYLPPGGPAAHVFSSTPGSLTGTVDLSSNVTQFGYTKVTPEPASYAFLLTGLSALTAMRRRRRS